MSKVLVIEDNPDMASLIEARLKREGHEVVCAGEGQKSVEMAREKAPDLIILDLILPLGDGLWVLQKLKKSPETKNIPVIVLTGLGSDIEYRRKIMDEGVAAYMEKPYKGEKLVEVVKNILGKTT